jgi:sugar/nucleoside kinase (ribokinase family)
MTAFDLLVLGDANPDLILTGDVDIRFGQEERVLEDAVLTVGGSGAITACAAARLGLQVAICGIIGDDAFGAFMREELAERGVDVRGLVRDPTTSTGVTVVLSKPDDRASLTSIGTIARLDAAGIDRALLGSARHVHVSQYFMQRSLRPGLAGLFDEAHAAGATTSIDPNGDPAERWDDGLRELLERTDVFLPNAVEALGIARESDTERAARSLARSGGTVVVKLGHDGALAVRGDEVQRAEAIPVAVRDATGAGDAFDAGFLAAHLAAEPLERSLRLAGACGALSTRAIGGVDALPTMEEALALLGSETLR